MRLLERLGKKNPGFCFPLTNAQKRLQHQNKLFFLLVTHLGTMSNYLTYIALFLSYYNITTCFFSFVMLLQCTILFKNIVILFLWVYVNFSDWQWPPRVLGWFFKMGGNVSLPLKVEVIQDNNRESRNKKFLG